MSAERDVLVAAYYFPNFHVDPRNEAWHGPGWTEWDLLKRAEPRFPGHRQPRVPLWGYEDEADPAVMSRKIQVAAAHGIDAFLFDWYWYDGRPYLERALEQAFLPASNADQLKFALMWANHDWVNIHPWKRSTGTTCLAPGAVDLAQFQAATDYIIDRYFHHPSYLQVDGRPFLSFYDLATLVNGLGGIPQAVAAITDLRRRASGAGFPDIHLNIIGWEHPVLPNETRVDFDAAIVAIEFDSVTSYVWVHHHRLPRLCTPYRELLEEAEAGWHRFAERYPVPYYPNVTVGWDPSPRTVQSDRYEPKLGYPHTNIITENSPEIFGEALERVRRFALGRSGVPTLVTINAWNEWTEGSYLEPDAAYGMAYLEELGKVFA